MKQNKNTWSTIELYNKDGVRVLQIRCKENPAKKGWKIIENGVCRKATHEEAAVYIDPDYLKRKERKAKRRENFRNNKINTDYEYQAIWPDDLQFSWC